MVNIRESHSFLETIPENLDSWLTKIKHNSSRLGDDVDSALLQAVNMVRDVELSLSDSYNADCHADANANANTAEPHEPMVSSLQAGLEMAEILSELGMGVECLQASILYRAVREQKLPIATVTENFGDDVATLIENVLHMAVITALRNGTSDQALGHDDAYQTSKVREMLVSIIDDVRVALLKLADRTYAIRAVKNATEDKRRAVAKEIFEIYVPLAHRLGIGHLKWELEDLAFRYMEPDEYRQIAGLLAEKRSQRQQYIDQMIETINLELSKLNKVGEVSGRAKNIYSIWRKMHRKDIGFSQVYDIRAVRVLVASVSDCYAVLGIAHSKWRNIPNEFDDYIASPKDNGYRSLHTAVIGPGRKVIEIQIRTFEMHEEAEFGICAHWNYKDSKELASKGYEDKMAWLRQVLEWHDNIGDRAVGDFLLEEKASDRVYVFTPKGHVVDLPNGATPVDFAYQIHTEIGHRCKGAKINDQIMPLTYPLKTADQVEIITGELMAPSRDWLNNSLGYIKTARAKTKVQQWFKLQNHVQNIEAGKALVVDEFHRLGIDAELAAELAGKFACIDIDDFYEKAGSGELDLLEIVNAAQFQGGASQGDQTSAMQQAHQFAQTDHYIYGVGDMAVQIADCCSPQPGQAISGYRSSGREVIVHRNDCKNLLFMRDAEPLKTLQLRWGRAPGGMFAVKIAIKSYDRGGLLRDITGLIDELGFYIQALNTAVAVDGVANIEIITEVNGLEELSRLVARMGQIPNVIDVWRQIE